MRSLDAVESRQDRVNDLSGFGDIMGTNQLASLTHGNGCQRQRWDEPFGSRQPGPLRHESLARDRQHEGVWETTKFGPTSHEFEIVPDRFAKGWPRVDHDTIRLNAFAFQGFDLPVKKPAHIARHRLIHGFGLMNPWLALDVHDYGDSPALAHDTSHLRVAHAVDVI